MKRLAAVLLASVVGLASGPAYGQAAQTPVEADTVISPLAVTGRREPAPEMMAPYAACLEAIDDPQTMALIAAGEMPRIYTRPRMPRTPDYGAPPKVAPGSALPEVMSLKDYSRYAKRMRRAAFDLSAGSQVPGAASEGVDLGLGQLPQGAMEGADATRLKAIINCIEPLGLSEPIASDRSNLTGPQPSPMGGRMEIQLRDKTLALGFALFDDGRYEEALEQFKIHDRKIGSAEGQLTIGKIYLFALREKSDPVEGVKWLKKMTEGRRPMPPTFDPREPELNTPIGEAAMILADIYRNGRGPIARDPEKSRKYLEKAYVFGHIRAASMLGDIYYQGVDGPQDLKLAFKNYMDAAKFAYVPAMNAVARMYAAGEVEGGPDPVKALAWRNEAAKANDPAGLYALAVAYDRGEGVTADPDRAIGLYKLAAMNGHPAALTALGTYFYRGEAGLPRDPAIARQWFEQAAIAGDPDGMFNLAAMMTRGEGGETDRVRAWGWLKVAQRRDHPDASTAARALEAQFTPADRAGAEQLSRAPAPPPPDLTSEPDPQAKLVADFVGQTPGGPPWWKVSKGEATIWIFGLPPGRTDATQGWNTAPLKLALKDARLLITPTSRWDRGPLDSQPWQTLPDVLGGQVVAAAKRFRLRLPNPAPTFSDAVGLYQAYTARNRLTDQMSASFYRVTMDQKVRLARPPRRRGPAVFSIDPDSVDVEVCVNAMLRDMSGPIEASKAAAQAWAAGDMAGALAAPRGVAWTCRVLWPDDWERTVGFQVEAIALALEMPGKVVAAADIGQAVAQGGILQQLRARGFTVSGPMAYGGTP